MINLDEAENFLLEIESEAAETLRMYYESGNFENKEKGGVDFLTQADSEVDEFIRKSLEKKYPQANILTEESAPKDYSSFLNLEDVFIIDPLDGTINFSRKNPNFGISIGLVSGGITRLAVINEPILGNIVTAREDKQLALLNGRPIHVSKTDKLKEAIIACGWSWNLEKRKIQTKWLPSLIQSVRYVKFEASAVTDGSCLAEGKLDAYLHSGIKPWDVAATSLIIEKAGGKITTSGGGKWNVFTPDMLASNGKLHEEILSLIK
jgi:myo-inositol-1(or 4)-monophosphatase